MILNGFGFLLGITLICVNLICPKRTRSNSGKYWEQDEDDLEIGKLDP